MANLPEADPRLVIHMLPVAKVWELLGVTPDGLTNAQAEERRRRFGRNVITQVKGKRLFSRFFANFTHLMALLLWVGGVAGFIAHMPQLGIAIWMVNLINGVFSFWQEYRAEKATEALRRLLPSHVRLLRDGVEQRLIAEELVLGDVILLGEGDRISADARLVEEAELRVDQSTLTGEAHPVRKTSEAVLSTDLARAELPNIVFAGTGVIAGTGKAVVFATGMESEFGKIAQLTQALPEPPSPLQKEISHVTRLVTALAVTVGLLFFLLAVTLVGLRLSEGFIFAMGMIVAFVPEGLLPTVTLSLAMGVQRMARRHALIKRLSAVETLGCATVIGTDKTGTLTQNEMTVTDLWVAGRRLAVTGVGYVPLGQILEDGHAVSLPLDGDLRRLLLSAGLCTNARLVETQGESPSWSVVGDPTEAALLVMAAKGGLDLTAETHRTPRLRELPFESRRKRMSTIHQVDCSRIAYIKGSPIELLDLCTHLSIEGEERPLNDSSRNQIRAANDDYACKGLRVLAFARRKIPDNLADYKPETVERGLTFLGLMAMMDPPRPEVAEAVAKCHRGGIRIIMITGDYGLTAASIARRIGIVQGERFSVLSGSDLDTMGDRALKEALRHDVIFARAAPEHKLRVVSLLQAMGHVVAVTGDGVNDAPALKKADIGIAMGLAGTDVAKEAADMILADDNFASIVNAVEEGRAVYANIKKFTTYIFTSNTPEAVPFIVFALSRGRIPLALNVMHVLSIDLGTDIVPALALGAEPPELGVMDRPPRNLAEHVVTRSLLLRAYIWLGLVQSLVVMAAFYYQYWINGYDGKWLSLPSSGLLYQSATAMALAAVVVTQIGNLFAQRGGGTTSLRASLFTNRLIWVGIVFELALVSSIIYIPFFQNTFGTAPFSLSNWLFLFAWMPSLWMMDQLRLGLLRRRERTVDSKRPTYRKDHRL